MGYGDGAVYERLAALLDAAEKAGLVSASDDAATVEAKLDAALRQRSVLRPDTVTTTGAGPVGQ